MKKFFYTWKADVIGRYAKWAKYFSSVPEGTWAFETESEYREYKTQRHKEINNYGKQHQK